MQTDTLFCQMNRTFFRKRPELASASVSEAIGQLKACPSVQIDVDRAVPEVEAIQFYMANHFLADVRARYPLHKPLPEAMRVTVGKAITDQSRIAVRLFYYLLLICTRESRHVHPSSAMLAKLPDKFGVVFTQFNKSLHGKSSGNAIQHFLAYDFQDLDLGTYAAGLCHVFYKGKFSGGFGGPKWGAVADVLCDYVHGKITAETMVDVGWTLCHNNGPIFNKGMYYRGYGPTLITLLDVQRAGQIPNLLLECRLTGDVHIGVESSSHLQILFDLYGNLVGWKDLRPYVDWIEVMALGSVNKYEAKAKAQIKKYGSDSEGAKKIQQAAEAEAAKKAMEKIEFSKKYYEVVPGQYLNKIQRAA